MWSARGGGESSDALGQLGDEPSFHMVERLNEVGKGWLNWVEVLLSR